MRLQADDQLFRVKFNVIDIGGKEMPFLAPVAVWAIGGLVAWPLLFIALRMTVRFVDGGFHAVIAAAGAVLVGQWVNDHLTGDRSLRARASTARSELRSIRRQRQLRTSATPTHYSLKRSHR